MLLCAGTPGDRHRFCIQQAGPILSPCVGRGAPSRASMLPRFEAASSSHTTWSRASARWTPGPRRSIRSSLTSSGRPSLTPISPVSGGALPAGARRPRALGRRRPRVCAHRRPGGAGGGGPSVVDRVVGVSMGAVIGALFAMGLDADEIDERCSSRSSSSAGRAQGLHAAALRAHPRRALRGNAAQDLRRPRDRGASARLCVRLRRAAQRQP